MTLGHGVEPNEIVCNYRAYGPDHRDASVTVCTDHAHLFKAAPDLTRPIENLMYVRDMAFKAGIVCMRDNYIGPSGEVDLGSWITHIPKERFRP